MAWDRQTPKRKLRLLCMQYMHCVKRVSGRLGGVTLAFVVDEEPGARSPMTRYLLEQGLLAGAAAIIELETRRSP